MSETNYMITAIDLEGKTMTIDFGSNKKLWEHCKQSGFTKGAFSLLHETDGDVMVKVEEYFAETIKED